MSRFNYIRYDAVSIEKQEAFKKKFEELEELAMTELNDSRPKALFLTALEEAYMWTGKAIRDEQLDRGSQVPHEAARG